ncbi:hypothetical protein GO986_16380 [Deinococcus sp. HMF7620]|uniref:Uncharacterized protein n=1 Tax=Deinococcus arboris TaxID=2682977 RepID=A0A7C9MSS8_9DEIO|nr:hypothetical protein [Deinococcus arboris]MVN88324.1 hypothetical protein [Deinococcus arboris]
MILYLFQVLKTGLEDEMSDANTTFTTPASWDRLLNTTDQPLNLAEMLSSVPAALKARRTLQLVMTTGNPVAIADAISELEKFKDEPVAGVRLMAAVALRHYPHVLATQDAPLTSLDPLAIEDTCDAAFARGMALGEAQQITEALAYLLTALKFAEALQMEYRAQHIEMEIGRLHTVLGDPQPERIINAMGRLPLSARRKYWGERLLASAYIAQGDYAAAAIQLAGQNSDLGGFTAVLLGHEGSCPDGPFAGPTTALAALRSGKPFSAPPIPGHSLQADYSALFRAWAMLRTRAMASQARNLLIHRPVRVADQRAHRAAALIQANAVQSLDDDIDHLIVEFNNALAQMPVREHFLRLLRAIQPDAYVLLGMLPGIHQEVAESLPEIAILTGTAITYRHTIHKLPGRDGGGAVLVRAAATGQTGPESRPHPNAHQRIRATVTSLEVSGFVNLGHAIRALAAFRSGARTSRQSVWTEALDRALSWVDSTALREDLRPHLGL